MDLRSECPPKVQTKVRTKWTKAAMPGPRNLHQNQAILQLLAHKQSPPPKSSRSRPIDYPWETKITPPPPRKKETNVDPSEEEAFQRIFRALRLEAYRRSGETKKEDDEKNAKAREEAAAKQAAAAEAQCQADAATIADAVQRALDKAQLQAIKTATELATLEKEQRVKRAAMEDTAEKLKASKDSTLKLKLGHAIAKRNISTAALMRLWDANGDGNLTKEEFMQALQRTLKLEATLKEMSALFDSFDEDRGGSVTINELQPAVARLHEDCRDEALKERLSRLKVAVYDVELAMLKDCLKVAQEVESTTQQLKELEARRTIVEDLGMLLNQKINRSKNTKVAQGRLPKGSGNAITPESLAEALAGQGGMVTKAKFIKYTVRCHGDRTLIRSPLLQHAHSVHGAWCMVHVLTCRAIHFASQMALKYASEILIPGNPNTVLAVLDNGFDTLLSRAGLDSRAATAAATAMRSFSSQVVLSKETGLSLSMSYKEAFRLIDKDGNNKISADELMAILITDEAKAAKTLLQSVIDMVDENGDGVLQLEEFETIWQLFLATRRDSGDNVGPVISATAAVNTLLRVGLEFSDTEKRLTEALGNFKKQAEILQTTYVEEVTRKQTEFLCVLANTKEKGSSTSSKAKICRIPRDWWDQMARW